MSKNWFEGKLPDDWFTPPGMVRVSSSALALAMANDEIAKRIREILLSDWDPIGVADVPQAADEYDSYIPRVMAALERNTTERDLTELLVEIEKSEIGLVGDAKRARHAARQLIAIGQVR